MGNGNGNLMKRLQVAPFPHASFGIFTPTAIALGHKSAEQYSSGNELAGSIYALGSLAATGIAVFAEFDAVSRFRQYARAKKSFDTKGIDYRFIRQMLPSRCQRDALKVAAIDSGYGKEISDYFKKIGYKWYHILPDFALKNPSYFFTKEFWKTSFFVKNGNGEKKRF